MRHTFCTTIIGVMALLFTLGASAQDIIVTNDARKIEAKITEVTKSEIRYKEKDYLDGPTFVIGTDEISSIIYANGKVVLYGQSAPKNESEPTEKAKESTSVTYNKQEQGTGQVQPDVDEDQTAQYSSSAIHTSGRIYRDNKEYLHNDRYISKKEVARILKQEDMVAYKQWKKADGLLVCGAVCTGIGAGLAAGGLVSLATGSAIPCIVMDCCALMPLGIGIGLCCGANSSYNKAIDIYNSKYDHTAVQLKWSVAADGVGLAIVF